MSSGSKRGRLLARCLFVGLVCAPFTGASAWAADRPSEDDMFGDAQGGAGGQAAATDTPGKQPPPEPPAAAAAAAAVGAPASAETPPSTAAPSGRDNDVLGDPNAGPRLSQETAPDDPLRIGGQLYLRANYSNPGSQLFDSTGASTGAVTFSAPSLVDGYFDARPNDRVRGFMLARMFFDPTLSATAATTSSTSGTAMSPTTPLVSGTSSTRGPSMLLDQLWIRFDVLRTIFVTAGRQHVRWGTARIWAPTDFLHPVRRNPTAVFDARPGFTMLKLHLPWEERGWNFYGFALVEGVQRWDRNQSAFISRSDSSPTLAQIGGAGRAELVLGPAELGLEIVAYKNQKPRYGADLSFGVGDFDLYVDAGFQYGSELPRVAAPGTRPGCDSSTDVAGCIYYSTGVKPQIAAGGSYSMKYNDNDVFTLGAEYFYNSRGYDDPHVYPGLFLAGIREPFYTGRHYAGVSATLLAPWSWNYTNFVFSTLGNLSDQSFISRLDYSHTLLTHMTFEAFGAVDYGRSEGEFRFGINNLMLGNQTFTLKPQVFSLGLGLRIKI